MIELRDVWFSYGKGWALKGVSLTFRGGPYILVGPNGSGKTTLLKVASALYPPKKGEVLIDGDNPWALKGNRRVEVRRRVVYVHEKPILIRGSVLENIAYSLTLRGVPREEALRVAEEALSPIAPHLKDKERGRLSSGEAQLVSLLRALVIRPDHLLLDEPTSNLDLDKRRAVVELLRGYKGTLVIATHDLLLARELGGKVIMLEDGRVREEPASI